MSCTSAKYNVMQLTHNRNSSNNAIISNTVTYLCIKYFHCCFEYMLLVCQPILKINVCFQVLRSNRRRCEGEGGGGCHPPYEQHDQMLPPC